MSTQVTIEQVQQALGALYLDLCAARAHAATLEHENTMLRGALVQVQAPAAAGAEAAPPEPDAEASPPVNGDPEPALVGAT